MMTDGTRHVVLVGLMGSGKSTVGRRLSARLGRVFLDTDQLVEEACGETVREIFEKHGEDEFRRREREALRNALDNRQPAVIAAAGGVVVQDANRAALRHAADRRSAVVVWLDTSVGELVERVKKGAHRPLLDADPRGTLARMDDDRRSLYSEVADITIRTDGRTLDDVTNDVVDALVELEAVRG